MIPFPKKKYSIIYADPPWHFKHWNDDTVTRKAPYNVMTSDDIYKLPVKDISNNDCVLFLWVTFPKLLDGLETIKQWGFTYKTLGFNWIKRNKKSDSLFWGLGYWTRANSELCLIATKGKVMKRASKGVHSVIQSPIEHHSKKPDIIRDKIVELCGDLPRIELFARQKVDGWDHWGNEV